MRRRNLKLAGFIAGSFALTGSAGLLPVQQACAEQARMSYSEDIAPIFKGWCVSCHQPGGEGFEASNLDLTTYEGLMKGTKFGPMVIPGEPDVSNLIQLIEGRASPEIRMPYGHKPLPNCLRQNIWTWIFQGAKDN
jgi:mono/diheme cytochrome c family protein